MTRPAAATSQGGTRRRYTTRAPLVVHPATFVPLSAEDEKRAMAAFAELLAPLFTETGQLKPDTEDPEGAD
ncbi:MAG: hypothetical protein ACYCYA_05255 [Actinomycetes bacterium]